jgi:hypothetical protein
MLASNFLEGNEIQRQDHRIVSAAAMFQKGIYHLFVLQTTNFSDAFDQTLRLYQCIFLLCATQMLLDFEGEKFSPKKLTERRDKDRINKDPGAAITHSGVEKWRGFNSKHPLHEISRETKQLYQNISDARHNLIYRPYFEVRGTGLFWEDCTLEELLRAIPPVNDVEKVYKDFYESVRSWLKQEDALRINFFKIGLVTPLTKPPLTLLLNYARVLNPKSILDLKLLDEIRKYRNQLLDEEFEEKFLDDELKKQVTV